MKHIVSRMSSYFPNRWPGGDTGLQCVLKFILQYPIMTRSGIGENLELEKQANSQSMPERNHWNC